MKENNFVSAAVYLDNSSDNIYEFLKMANDVFKRKFKKWEFICIGAGLENGVLERIKKFNQENKDATVSLIDMGFPQGLEAAMNAGTDLAIGDYIYEFDTCMFDYDPELILKVYEKAISGYDIAAAVPSKQNNKQSSKIFYNIYNHFSRTKEKIGPERFRILSRRAVNRTCSYGRLIPYRKAVYASSGLRMANLEYDTIGTKNKIRCKNSEKMNTAIDALVIFTDLAYKFSLCISILMAMFMMFAGVYTVIVYFGMNKPVEGWAPLMGMISLAFFSVFIILTIIIKYLDILLKLVFKRQKYLISSVERL